MLGCNHNKKNENNLLIYLALSLHFFYTDMCSKFMRLFACIHPEKCFVESTKIWLAQQSFSFKYEPMKILFELTKKILLIFFAIPIKKFCIGSKRHGIAN